MAEQSEAKTTDEDRNERTALLTCGKHIIWTQRCSLPAKMASADFNVWSFVKQCIGKDLTKISMPVALNEPISFLQRIAEYMEYSELLGEAVKQTDPVRRLEYVCAFAVSATSSNWNRTGKPFNPLLGETYELHHRDFVFVAEQVSHHPPITAFHVEASNYRLWSTVQFKLRFWGKSIEVQPKGVVTLELLNPHELYTWQNPNLIVHNVLLGKIWVEHVGTMTVTNHTLGYTAELEFQPTSWFAHVANQVVGKIYKSQTSNSSIFGASLFSTTNESTPMRVLYGDWTRGLFSVEHRRWEEREKGATSSSVASPEGHGSKHQESEGGDPNPSDSCTGPQYGFEIPLVDQRCLWLAHPRPTDSGEFYNFTRFTLGLNELTPELHEARFGNRASVADTVSQTSGLLSNGLIAPVEAAQCPFLPPTDCRFRPDIRALELGNLDAAAVEKNRLEEKQRHMRKLVATEHAKPHSTRSSGNLMQKKPSPISSMNKSIFSHSSDGGGTGLLHSQSQPTRSRSSTGPLLVVGPVWFEQGQNELTKQDEWRFTGDYWSRDWSRCPDLY